jgi:SM-20-related protein
MKPNVDFTTKLAVLSLLSFAQHSKNMNSWIDQFEQHGWAEIKGFMNETDSAGIRSEIIEIQNNNGFRQASIGKQDSKSVDTSQRGDFIRWIDAQQAPNYTRLYLDKMTALIEQLNYTFYLGIRDYECHYAHYPPGTFYKKHVDRHKNGSPRRVSSVLYLNADWQPSDGGELVIYEPEGNEHRIQPLQGTLAIFLSELEHEVLLTSRDRMSITGWMLNETIL